MSKIEKKYILNSKIKYMCNKMFSNLYNIMKKKKYSSDKENITSLNDIVVSLKDDEDSNIIDNELKTISEKNKYDTELLKKSAIFFLISI